MNRKSWALLCLVAVAVVLTSAAIIHAAGEGKYRACATCQAPGAPNFLPPVGKGPMQMQQSVGESVLLFDDGTCESGLGVGATITDLHEFDVPTQCIQGGLDVIQLTTRMNTGVATAFAWAQEGATPPPAGGPSFTGIPTINAFGPCPATALTSVAVGPGVAVITGTSNFFAGLRTPSGFAGRDTTNPAGRMWSLCASCGMTQYSPTDFSNLGLGGNWMIRVTVEDQNCVPVELMGFDVEK